MGRTTIPWATWRFPPGAPGPEDAYGDPRPPPSAPGLRDDLILAGYGFRTEPTAHSEAQEALGRPVVSLRLVDPRLYHLDVALAALDDTNIAYHPGAFSPASQQALRQLFPNAPQACGGPVGARGVRRVRAARPECLADEADALAFGLNLVSDGRHVLLNSEASGLAAKLAAAGYPQRNESGSARPSTVILNNVVSPRGATTGPLTFHNEQPLRWSDNGRRVP